MFWIWILAWSAGLAGVIQNGLSKQLGEKAGLASVLHISNLIVLIGGVTILSLIATQSQGEFSQLLRMRLNARTWSWWFLIPGFMGLFVITVTPYAIMKLGALKVFILFVFGQVLGSLAWDYWIEKLPVDMWRLAGVTLTLLGAISISMSKPAT